ncbi:putative gamma-glutamylcyclotransferase CG2811 isoform X2 [Leptopilina heterotoma]|uniref:putative gamma-glutamylcyclotransferase CG2811 isoform X2 n=1 Tax=Leptopilina heterotoma TaxID=63436 RepID=UPI001CA8C86F|nr:putative gamma-glutamylcyclotransferase CG2811 isoform X2 [Leptopilina heterotoma]
MNSLYRVFVYGTLKRGEPNHKLIENTTNGYAKFLGSGKTVTKYPLVIATKFNVPFLLKKSGIGHQIIGEVYDVDTEMLKKLDELEEHPDFYLRTEEHILLDSQDQNISDTILNEDTSLIKAWIYFLPNFKTELLEQQMFSSYSNNGSHGLKYRESENEFSKPEDVS